MNTNDWEEKLKQTNFYPKLVDAVIVGQVQLFISSLLNLYKQELAGKIEGMKVQRPFRDIRSDGYKEALNEILTLLNQ